MKTLLLCIALGLFFRSQSVHSETAQVWVHDGKAEPEIGFEFDLLPAQKPLENYAQNLWRISKYEFSEKCWQEDSPELPKGCMEDFNAGDYKVKEIGNWNTYTVFDVQNSNAGQKSILLRDRQSGNFRIIYVQFEHGSADLSELPKLIKAGGHSVLAYTPSIPGTGAFRLELYWLLEEKSKKLTVLDMSAVKLALKKAPKDYQVRRGAGFDLEKLSLSSPLWKGDDADCCPTGGTLSATFAIKKSKLVLLDSQWSNVEKASTSSK
jgi:hypothetical protein